MSHHLIREIDGLKRSILALGAITEESLDKVLVALRNRDRKLAEAVMAADYQIDSREVEIEEECLKILALHQPVASDLRFIVACLKINAELERIGDATVNIAERIVYLAGEPEIDVQLDFPRMTACARAMVGKSLDALVNADVALAYDVIKSDDEVDDINRQMYFQIQDAIRQDTTQLESLIHYLGVSRHLERIADHTTNIAEDVIYMTEGEIVRHRVEEYGNEAEKLQHGST